MTLIMLDLESISYKDLPKAHTAIDAAETLA